MSDRRRRPEVRGRSMSPRLPTTQDVGILTVSKSPDATRKLLRRCCRRSSGPWRCDNGLNERGRQDCRQPATRTRLGRDCGADRFRRGLAGVARGNCQSTRAGKRNPEGRGTHQARAEARTKRARTYSAFIRTAGRYSAADLSMQSEAGKAPYVNKPCVVGKRRTCGIVNSVFAD